MRNNFKIVIVLLLVIPSAYGEDIDGIWCQSSEGFSQKMESQGFQREMTLPFGWGEYDSSVSHNISGSDVNTYDKKMKNRWVLYTNTNGQWKIFQGVERVNLKNGQNETFICEVKSGNKLERN